MMVTFDDFLSETVPDSFSDISERRYVWSHLYAFDRIERCVYMQNAPRKLIDYKHRQHLMLQDLWNIKR